MVSREPRAGTRRIHGLDSLCGTLQAANLLSNNEVDMVVIRKINIMWTFKFVIHVYYLLVCNEEPQTSGDMITGDYYV